MTGFVPCALVKMEPFDALKQVTLDELTKETMGRGLTTILFVTLLNVHKEPLNEMSSSYTPEFNKLIFETKGL